MRIDYVHAPGKKNGKLKTVEPIVDPVEAAEEAGLRYVSDDRPGYTRKAKGDDFEYFDLDGKAISDEQRLLRIKRLVIPPAWTDVWICPVANGHIQATGRDARKRKQYKYHERWREVRDENKYGRIIIFAEALPKIRRRVTKDIKLPGLQRNKILATVVQLLERTFIRIGNEEYARENKSFGLTTMKDRHVDVKGTKVSFKFRGKSGKDHEVDIRDPHIARIVSRLQDLPGQDLFQYVDEDGKVRDINSQDVNDYLREVTGENFTAKDFRTWAGTVLAAIALGAQEKFETKSQGKSNVTSAIKAVAQMLGNTAAVCRKCYIHPDILADYLEGNSIEGLKQVAEEKLENAEIDLRTTEKAVLKFLKKAQAA